MKWPECSTGRGIDYFVGHREASRAVELDCSAVESGSGNRIFQVVFQRGSSLQQSTDEMLSSVFEYVKGATTSRCEEAETPAVAVS